MQTATPTQSEIDTKAFKAMINARCQLMLGGTATTMFFSALALRLALKADHDVDTGYTDGKCLGYSPDFVNAQSKDECKGFVVHEVMHCVYDHFGRLGDRENVRFNVACDLAINQIIRNSKFVLPNGALFPGEGLFKDLPEGKSAEEYYNLLPKDIAKKMGGDGKPGSDPGGCGGVRKPCKGSPAEIKEIAADWKQAIVAAHSLAKQKGSLPSDLDRLVGEILAPVVDWREQLRKFVTQHAKSDYTWSRPNRRFVSQGMHLPSMHSEELGKIVVTVDTSGSVDNAMLGRFAGELNGILDCLPCSVEILYHHCNVYKRDTWSQEDGPLTMSGVKTGGTSHADVFAKIEEMPEQPVAVICLSDLYTDFPERTPDMPVLWACTSGIESAPFGEIIKVKL